MDRYYYEYELLIDLPTGERKGDRFFLQLKDSEVYYQAGRRFRFASGVDSWRGVSIKGETKIDIKDMTPDKFKPIGSKSVVYK